MQVNTGEIDFWFCSFWSSSINLVMSEFPFILRVKSVAFNAYLFGINEDVFFQGLYAEDARGIVEQFQADLDSGFYIRIALEPVHYNLAREWIGRFDTPLRTLDALHLAIAARE